MTAYDLALFYDGNCVFCTQEMTRLRRWDTAGRLGFVDIAEPDFDPAILGVDMAALNAELHSLTSGGQVLVGIDSLLAAYSLVGRGWIMSPLRVRLLRPVFSTLYRKFARHRYRISSLLGLSAAPACAAGTCSMRTPN